MKFRTDLRVRYADTDAQGIVYNGAFFQFLEVARFEMIEQLLGAAEAAAALWDRVAVKEITITYLRPLRFPDRIVVETTVEKVGTSSLHLSHRVRRDGCEAEAATARVTAVYTNEERNEARSLPEELRANLSRRTSVPDSGTSEV